MLGLLIKEINMSHSKILYISNAMLTFSYYLRESVNTVIESEFESVIHIICLSIFGSFPVLFLSFESNNKQDKYFACLPYDRFQYVLSKYILATLMPFVFILLGLLLFKGIDIFLCLIIFLPLFSMPLYYHRGGKQGASNTILLTMLCDVLLVVLKILLPERFNNMYISIQGVPIFLVALASLWFCSFLLSVHFYKKRDI